MTPLAGLVTDRFGRKPTLITAGVLLTVGTVSALALLNDSALRLIVIQVVGHSVIALIRASSMPAYAELFPKASRAAGFDFPYSLTVGLQQSSTLVFAGGPLRVHAARRRLDPPQVLYFKR